MRLCSVLYGFSRRFNIVRAALAGCALDARAVDAVMARVLSKGVDRKVGRLVQQEGKDNCRSQTLCSQNADRIPEREQRDVAQVPGEAVKAGESLVLPPCAAAAAAAAAFLRVSMERRWLRR